MNNRAGKNQVHNSNGIICLEGDYRLLLNRYQDNELDLSSRQRLEEHVKTCAACRMELISLQSVQASLRGMTEVDTGLNFNARLMAKITEQPSVKAAGWLGVLTGFRIQLPSVVYSLVFILFLAFGFWVQGALADTPTAVGSITGNVLAKNQTEHDISDILSESQQLSLLQVQSQTLALLINGENTGTKQHTEFGVTDEQ
jgi:putative zinc finger protein